MATHDSLKSLVRQYIKTNGQHEITGQILQNVLIAMIDELGITIDPTPTKNSSDAVSSGGTFGALQQLNEINATLSGDGKIYNNYQAGDIYYTEQNSVRVYWVALADGEASEENPVTISDLNFYHAENATDAVRMSLSTKTFNIDAYTKQESDAKYQPKGNYQPAGDYATEQQLAGKANASDVYTKSETYSKTELDNLITTPNQQYVSVTATAQTTAITDLLPATGAADTIYRVGNWDGTQYDPTMYALFAWNGTTYVCLAVRSFVDEVYDVSVNHPDGQGNPTPYADLTAALGSNGVNIPADIRRGGMSIKFIQGNAQSSDNKYVKFFCTADEFTTDVTQWQGVDNEISANSKNLVESGVIYDSLNYIPGELHNGYITQLKWANLDQSNRQHKVIPIDSIWVGKKLNIKSNTIGTTDVAFLSEYAPEEGSSNGIIEYHGNLIPSEVSSFTIPQGTTCIYLLWISATSRVPDILEVDGINLLKDIKGALNEAAEKFDKVDDIDEKKADKSKLLNNISAYKSNNETLSDGITIGDAGFIEMVFTPVGEQIRKCIFDKTGNVRFYIDINSKQEYIIKITSIPETPFASVTPNRKVKIKVIWDGVTDANNKTYSVYVNDVLKLSGVYTGIIEGDFKIKNEGSWVCADAIWYYVNVNGTLLMPNDTFETVYSNYDSGEEVDAKISEAISPLQPNGIISLNPDIVTKIANSARSYHFDESGSTEAENPLVLLHFSDIHGDSVNLDRLLEFAEDAKISPYIDNILHTGDVVTTFAESISFWNSATDVLNILGNHEYWGDVIDGHRTYKTPLECYDKFIAPYKNSWQGVTFPSNPETGKSYWYKDYTDKKVRLIGIDYREMELNQSSTQLDWLTSVMNETLDGNKTCYGYHVIIAAHTSAFRTKQDYKNPFDSIDILSNADGVLLESIANAVDTFIGNHGKFVCYLAGHNHTDHFGLGSSHPNQLNIAIATASRTNSANTWEIGRVNGTKSQDLFNIVSIDTYCSILKLVRVGCDTDRQLRHKDTLCFYYGNDEFDASVSYKRGKIVKYNDKFYQFVIPHTGAWSNSDVCEVDRLIQY